MRAGAKTALQAESDSREIEIEQRVDGKLLAGNRRGLNISTELGSLRNDVTALRKDLKEATECLQAEGKASKSEITALEDRVDALKAALSSYKQVRGRFISTFKRDKLGAATDNDRAIIRGGNATAHAGDAVTDAQLYGGTSGRRDAEAYVKLYGLDPHWVLKISESFTVHHSYCRVILGCSSSNWFSASGHHCRPKQPRFHHFFGQENWNAGVLPVFSRVRSAL